MSVPSWPVFNVNSRIVWILRPRRVRTRSARYAASLAERLGLIERPRACSWCRRHGRLERHHWDYTEPLNVTFLCVDCHDIADQMVVRSECLACLTLGRAHGFWNRRLTRDAIVLAGFGWLGRGEMHLKGGAVGWV